MAVDTRDNTFTTNVTGEAASPLVAGMISFNGLIPRFGTTGSDGNSEVETGIMTINDLNNWIGRLSTTLYPTGPTGNWAGEWWAVHNYLQYGGVCLVGGTGSTGDYYSSNGVLGITKTPLHNKSLASFDVIFDSGNTFSAGAAIDIATTRKDCVAIIGNYQKITGVPGLAANYSNKLLDFGFDTNSEYVIYVAGRKKFVSGIIVNSASILESNVSPDVAGCMARTARDSNIIFSPAGKTKGRILGVVSMQQVFGETDSEYLYGGNVNPVVVFPGEGTFLMGNKTSVSGSLSRINTVNTIISIKKSVLPVAQNFLFTINNASTRSSLVSSIIPILDNIRSLGGVTNYRVVCDTTNNTTTTIAENKLIVDIYIQVPSVAETLVITIINTNTSEAFSS